MNNLYDAFHKHFEVVVADTPELQKKVFQMRYHMLGIERRFPGYDLSDYSDGLVKDDYDVHSCHLLLKLRVSKELIGTVRLILPSPADHKQPFPVELHTQIDPILCDLNKLSHQQTAEISRFIVLKKFERRRGERRNIETRQESSEESSVDRRQFPDFGLALAIGIMRVGLKFKIVNLLSMMEPALNKLLSRSGLKFDAIGPSINYHGWRRPYYINLVDVLEKLRRDHHDIWRLVMEGIEN